MQLRFLSVVMAVALWSCGGTATDSAPETDQATTTSTMANEPTDTQRPGVDATVSDYIAVGDSDGRPEITVNPSAASSADALLIDDVRTGDGPAVEVGDLIEVHYVGLLTDGTQFDASWDRGQTFFVQIGVGNLIQGWDQGVVGMAVGGRRALVIPSELAYGPNGAGDVIPADATLTFVVDVLQVVDMTPPEVPSGVDIGAELEIIDVTVGDGAIVEAGDVITVNYQGSLLDGTIFDSSWNRGQPFTTAIGVGQVIQGWDLGMVGMAEGGRRILLVPSALAYGSQGAGGSIGPDTPLVFVVDLLRVQG